VAEIVLPYAPVAQAISTQTKRIDYVLFAVAILFYAALWPRLLRASRAIRSQADPEKQALRRELENAIKHDELLLHYQPAIDLNEGRVVAVEALLRWQHPKRGLLSPNEFLPTLTDDDLNGRLTLHVVGMALHDCGEWRDRGIDAAVNVNLTVANVIDDDLPEQIGKLLATCGIPPAALGLEVTETAIVADPEKAAVMLDALHRMGVRIAIDDYGTGYSSLAVLRDLPISELKIDKSFVVGLRKRPRDEAIVRSTIRLAHELEVKVIAEGVEDHKTVSELVALDCDMAQGYYFSLPLSLPDLVAWFEAPMIAGGAAAEPAAGVTEATAVVTGPFPKTVL
jgi:EAL domain-containing protein (putative c-di-GMP-specific phosphodiesterase class I)